MPLGGVLASLSHGDDLEFPALQPYQRHAWHAFLTQLGALALHHGKRELSPMSYYEWTALLLALTGGQSEPYTLVVEDLSKAAFLQCPVPEKAVDPWDLFQCPDAIDVLVTAKNHDVKMARIARPTLEHWVYALVSVQTMQGFWGRGHYGIARMNSGTGSRGCVAMAPSESWSPRFCRDVAIWLEQRDAIGFKKKGGLALLWLDPWNGQRSLDPSGLDPFFIEACSRIRLVQTGDSIGARATHVQVPHIAASKLKGNTGEIWTPIRVKDNAALTLKQEPFSYTSACDLLLSEEWQMPAALVHQEQDGPSPVILLQGLARGQGKTEGYYQRTLYLTPESTLAFRDKQARAELYRVSQLYVDAAASMRLRVLKPGLLSLAQAAPERIDFEDKRIQSIVNSFTERVDEVFFTSLFSDVKGEQLATWIKTLAQIAEKLFLQAASELPIPVTRRVRTVAMAARAFYGSLRNLTGETGTIPEYFSLTQMRVRFIACVFASNTSAQNLALLRRLAPGDLQHEVFDRLHKRLLHSEPDAATGRNWTIIFRAMATLASLHRGNFAMGRALAYSGYPERRLAALLSSHGEPFERDIRILTRWMGLRGIGFDHADLAELVLSADQPWGGTVRKAIARAFYSSL